MLLNRKISIFYFVNEIKWQLLIVIVFSTAAGIIHLHPFFEGISIPLGLLTLMGTAISILLAFRTSQSYERWWEARIVWGAIVNDSRTLIRVIKQFSAEQQVVKSFAQRQVIWAYALGETLRKVPYSDKVQPYLTVHAIKGSNIPNAILDEHSSTIGNMVREGKLSELNQMQLNEIVARLCDSMGKCERIKNTVFPRSYSVLLHTLIYVFTAILPFGLTHEELAIEILICILIPLMFITIEKTAIIMQDPFENTPVDTPMTALARTIEINLTQMSEEEKMVVKEENTLYYEM